MRRADQTLPNPEGATMRSEANLIKPGLRHYEVGGKFNPSIRTQIHARPNETHTKQVWLYHNCLRHHASRLELQHRYLV